MTLHYVGTRQYKARLAEIEYKEGEEEKFEFVYQYLRSCGWDLDAGVMFWAGCVVENKHEYDLFKEDYDAAKKLLRSKK